MDAFESIIAMFLERRGYWTLRSVKVKFKPHEKVWPINKYSPTLELDVVAYKPRENELILIECKSFLDSSGVRLDHVRGLGRDARRYRLIHDVPYRTMLKERIESDFLSKGLISENPNIKFGLAAGNIYEKDKVGLVQYCNDNGIVLYTPETIQKEIKNLRSSVYLNDEITLTVKLLRNHLKEDGTEN
jgi:hypothetical protein